MASSTSIIAIRIPLILWAHMIFKLRQRGAGKAESGAFLLGLQSGTSTRVTKYICYDDLDPHAYQSGGIAFHASGYSALWQYCRENKLKLLADVHTHPGKNVQQSQIDQRNPMIPIPGHTAIIIPNFGQTRWWSLSAVGVYEYLGNFKWRTHDTSKKPRRITLTIW